MNSPTSQRWMIRLQQTATFVFLIYVLTLLGRSAWSNAQSNRKMEKLRTEISELKHENDYLKNLEIYVQTESFRELEARQKLGLKKPGEIVIALPPEPEINLSPSTEEQNKPDTRSLIELWLTYLIG